MAWPDPTHKEQQNPGTLWRAVVLKALDHSENGSKNETLVKALMKDMMVCNMTNDGAVDRDKWRHGFMEEQYDMVQQQRVTIHNTHGEKLVGIMHETGSTELVIICHGFKSSKDRIPMVNLALALGKEGISAFRFDFAGNGESDGVFRYGSYRREANDLRDVVQYFYRENRSIAAIIGHSKGGNAVLLYASTYNDVHIIVNISGCLDLKRGIEGRLGKDFLERIKQHGFIDVKNRRGKVAYRVTEESLMDCLTTDMHGACLSIPNSCRVLTVHGSMDEMVPVEDAYEFNKCISNHKLRIIEGADHEFTSHQDELTSIVLYLQRLIHIKTKTCLHGFRHAREEINLSIPDSDSRWFL